MLVEESTYAEAVTLIEPENQPAERVSQYSVVTKAMEHHTLMNRFDSMKRNMSEVGLEFGARVLLIGPPGTDFEAFSHHLCREVPLKMVRFKMEEILNEAKRGSELLRVGFEFARRNSPTVMLVERVDTIAPSNSDQAAILLDEVTRTSWDGDEVLVVGSTTRPSDIDAELLAVFDRTYIIEGTSLEDRVRILEQILKNREDLDPTVVAELTDGWSFASMKRLAVSLFMSEAAESGQIPTEQIEEIIEKSGSWKMDVRQKYSYIINKLATGSAEFSKAEQETLAIIAFKQPIKQSVLIKIRGNKAYDHVKKFSDLGLIRKKKVGRTHELSLSEEFYDYFNVSEGKNPLKAIQEEV